MDDEEAQPTQMTSQITTEMVFILFAPVGAKTCSPALPNLEMSGKATVKSKDELSEADVK